MGHLLLLNENESHFEKLKREPLGAVAYQLRQSLARYDDLYVRSFVHALKAEQDKTVFRYGANTVVGRDLTVSSWSGLKFGRSSFGPLLGVPDFVRRPIQADCEGLIYFMPPNSAYDIDVALSLRDEDFRALRNDPEWIAHAETLG